MNDGTNARRFHVLYVCHANVCRSPMAHRMLEWSLADRWGPGARERWQVSSAGVRHVQQQDMDPKARRVLEEMGVPSTLVVPTLLTPELVQSADLVLTAERVQRAAVAALVPTAVHRTFTMRQFARLAGAVHENDLSWRHPHELMESALRVRGELQPGDPALDDIADPIGRPLRDFRLCSTTIKDTVDAMLTPFVRSASALAAG